MADEWYYTTQGQQCGPVSTAELKQLAVAQQLQPSDLVWREGLAKWVPASSAKGLFPEGHAVAPAPAAAPAAAPAGPTPVAPLDDLDDDLRPPRRRDGDDYDRPRRRRRDDDLEDDYDRPRRRRSRGSSTGLIIGLVAGGVGLVVVVGVVVLLIVLLGGAGSTTLTLHNGQVSVNGRLSHSDSLDRRRQQCRARTYSIKLTAGKRYQIDMVSAEIDSYLRLEGPTGQPMLEDDDGGGFPNARIVFQCQQTGTYRITCTTFAPGMTGGYTLSVREF
jgi:hypothetical protein